MKKKAAPKVRKSMPVQFEEGQRSTASPISHPVEPNHSPMPAIDLSSAAEARRAVLYSIIMDRPDY